jgi:uncharacterized membrane protein
MGGSAPGFNEEESPVTVHVDRTHRRALHPLHAAMLAGTVPLFLGAVLSDLAYWSSYHVQWSNFSSWLIAGGLVFGGLALLAAIIGRFRAAGGHLPIAYLLLLLVSWILGLGNAFIHALDAWASMPAGLILSVVVAVLACAATWIGLSGKRTGGAR